MLVIVTLAPYTVGKEAVWAVLSSVRVGSGGVGRGAPGALGNCSVTVRTTPLDLGRTGCHLLCRSTSVQSIRPA